MKSRLTGLSVTKNCIAHNVKTAYTGAWLGVFGTALLFVAWTADMIRLGSKAPADWLFLNSWWLTVPLLLNMVILCPTVIIRGQRAKKAKIPIKERIRANLAVLMAYLLMLASAAYLLSVWLV